MKNNLILSLIILAATFATKAQENNPLTREDQFCELLDSVYNSVFDGYAEFVGTEILHDSIGYIYESNLELTPNGNVFLYGDETFIDAFEEYIEENLTLREARNIFTTYLDKINECFGESMISTEDSDQTLHATDDLFLYLDIYQDAVNAGKYSVVLYIGF